MVRAPGKDTPLTTPFSGVPGMASWVEALWANPGLAEGVDLQAGLGVVGDLNEPAGDGEASLFSQLLP